MLVFYRAYKKSKLNLVLSYLLVKHFIELLFQNNIKIVCHLYNSYILKFTQKFKRQLVSTQKKNHKVFLL